MLEERYRELRIAEKGALISIFAYILIATLKLSVGKWANSEALQADGLNNFTDILASIAVLIGLRLARRPADAEHRYGHWKVENVASMITSFIMVLVGLQVFATSIQTMLHGREDNPDAIAGLVGIVSAIIMYGVYTYNNKLAHSVKSGALKAAAKDNLSDALTSIGTSIAVFASFFHLYWLDNLAAIVIGIIIIKTGFEIFQESAFSLSDGFPDEDLLAYKQDVLKIPGVKGVKSIRGRSYGAMTFIDIVVYMDAYLSVKESHSITEEIEQLLQDSYQVFDTDVHVEPCPNSECQE
ncbi:cation diffusion facilitator family transporter [Vagococcus humatus]|uniref:Transporter n=1 Tax=Vagococcus humatus TaxID=1889241 RepID=A0A429Z8J8_9ENTE|nr:cation diffusion facilitator family transporter [Vagococcus humatus]RST90049.1 transporter [Vagococcus humatus]